MAVSRAATATPARTMRAAPGPSAPGDPDEVGRGNRQRAADEGEDRQQRRGVPGIDDVDGGPEPGAGRHAEQIRVRQRVAEDSLVGRAAGGEHGADQAGQHDTGRRSCQTTAWLMAGVLVWKWSSGTWASSVPITCDGGTATGPVQNASRETPTMRTAATAIGTQVRRTPGPRSRGTDRRGDCSGRAVVGHDELPPTGCAFISAATSERRTTIRGPHREAMSSLRPSTRPSFTAARLDQPGRVRHGGGRLAAADRVGQEDVVRVRLEDELAAQLRVAATGRGPLGRVGDVVQAEQAEHLPDERARRGRVVRLVELVVVGQRMGGPVHRGARCGRPGS